MLDSGSGRYVQSWQRACGKHRGRWNYRDRISDGDESSQPAGAGRHQSRDDIGESCKRNCQRDNECHGTSSPSPSPKSDADAQPNSRACAQSDSNTGPDAWPKSKPDAHAGFNTNAKSDSGTFTKPNTNSCACAREHYRS